MWLRSFLSLPVVAVTSLALAASMFAQQVPNPVLPGPSGTGDGLTREALDTPPADTSRPTSATPAPPATASARRTTHRATTAGSSARNKNTYASISRHHRRRHAKKSGATLVAKNTSPAKRQASAKPRAPLVSFIFWWNGWVVRTFHTRSGTVLLDTIGAKT